MRLFFFNQQRKNKEKEKEIKNNCNQQMINRDLTTAFFASAGVGALAEMPIVSAGLWSLAYLSSESRHVAFEKCVREETNRQQFKKK